MRKTDSAGTLEGTWPADPCKDHSQTCHLFSLMLQRTPFVCAKVLDDETAQI